MQSQPLTQLNHAELPLLLMAVLLIVFSPLFEPELLKCSIFPKLDHQNLRWLSSHFCHSSWQHWAVNAIGLCLFTLLFRQRFTALALIALVLGLITSLNLYLYFFYPLDFYLGFSAILYGLYTFAALHYFRQQRLLNAGILVAIFAQIALAATQPSALIDLSLTVATDMHLVAITSSGLFYGLVLSFTRGKRWLSLRRKN